jgi:disulfide bond formation protein DsbB
MKSVIDPDEPLMVTLDRLILWLMLLALAGVLTAAMGFQYFDGEIPCPLCLLQRVAMFGCCFGLMRQLHDGSSQRGTGIALIFTVMLLVISVRQTLLDIVPRPGHAYIGRAVFGIHMPVWSILIAVALFIGFAARFALFGGPRTAPPDGGSAQGRWTYGLGLYVVTICAINFLSVLAQCGLGECHTTGYALLR